jgi:S-adenosylmethionine:tRNA ribosyltransferase-isomerase
MKLSLFDYELPKKFIAQNPIEKRDQSKLMVLDKNGFANPVNYNFSDLPKFLNSGDTLVINNTKVIPARLKGYKKNTLAKIEILLIEKIKKKNYKSIVKNAKKVDVGDIVIISNDLSFECTKIEDDGIRFFKLIYEGQEEIALDRYGETPLPPYIKSKNRSERYQTIYAKLSGSSAAPTAGLHFTRNIFKKLEKKGIEIIEITLHVGLGTFQGVKSNEIEKHKMHEETYIINEEAANRLNNAHKNNKRIISVGTTSMRALESNFKDNKFYSGVFKTSIFIYPGYKFKIVDGLITNFHLPKSSLLMLVSAFAKRKYILNAYEFAKKNNYRFFSFGDAMLIL